MTQSQSPTKKGKLLILKGLPASGKTTYAKELVDLGWKRVNKDDIRAMVDNGKWSKKNEKLVCEIQESMIIDIMDTGVDIVVDDTNLNPVHIKRFKELVDPLWDRGYEVEEKFFDTPINQCILQDEGRESSVGRDVIIDMAKKYLPEQYAKEFGYKPDYIRNDPAVIFDIDGTLAKMGDRSPYDWEKIREDELIEPVKYALDVYKDAGYKIIIFTGRDGCCEDETRKWLLDNDVHFDYFSIRPEGSTEKDAVIKERMFDEIKDKFAVEAVFDDRDQVVKMWRSLGLQCFQCNYGSF